MKVAYSPFNCRETVNLIAYNISKFHRWTPLEKFDSRVRQHDGTTSCLRNVSRNQQLYIFGHGAPRANDIDSCSGESISIEDLAGRLLLDGLSLAHRKIKLHSCSGGVGGNDSMAAKLKRAMITLGYTGLTVYGYTEDLSTTTRRGMKRGMSGRRAKKIRVTF